MSESLVLVGQQGAVRTLTLNRPKALNSFTQAMHVKLLAELKAAAADSGVRCLVLTGAGRGFCAGQDLADEGAAPAPEGQSPTDLSLLIERHYRPLCEQLRAMPMPVIAAVNGVAAGAGANIALCCDLVVACESASFIQAFTRIGLLPDSGGTWLLPHLVGRQRALGLALLGDKLSAHDAEAMGLIWRALPDAGFELSVADMANKLAAMPVKALIATRNAIDAAQHLSFEESLALEAQTQKQLGCAHDYLEGVSAFMDKRTPVFTDR
ncbi:MAG: 2-(1,2-epoxy-1,2-dihydrophenyl)acetyl-CoA isomerase PaaG [Comamonas sp.]|jgi:2-(1,2-epoxy-1,2-dihydrophenyl)acetyl-CoA isomerase|nr:2-(1,2-epoxy-1,2-dihydrophenyl)acetyl-CoA isomerase PaaG [Comamonas sp.]